MLPRDARFKKLSNVKDSSINELQFAEFPPNILPAKNKPYPKTKQVQQQQGTDNPYGKFGYWIHV
jgi:hypothetical protein